MVKKNPMPTSTALVPVDVIDNDTAVDVQRDRPAPRRPLLEMWLEGRSPNTLAAYRDDVVDFALFLERTAAPGFDLPRAVDADRLRAAEVAASFLVQKTQGEANELVLSYRNHLRAKQLAPATVNRRLGALRSLVKLANLLGHIPWVLGVQNIKHEPYKDTAGPGVDVVLRMIETAAKTVPKSSALRNVAVLRLLFNRAMRRGEIAELRIEHVRVVKTKDGPRIVLSIMGKGRTERENLDLSASASAAVGAWLKERGTEPGSLFYLTGHGIWAMVKRVAAQAGIDPKTVWPHGFRHSGITGALDAGSSLRDTMKFSRHKNLNTLQIYDDNRANVAKDVGDKLDDFTSGNKKGKP